MDQILGTPALEPVAVAVCVAPAVAWGYLVWTLAGIVLASRRRADALDAIEQQRVEAVRKSYPFFRWFEPIIVELAAWKRKWMGAAQRERLVTDLSVVAPQLDWQPEEYLATKQFESFLLGAALTALLTQLSMVLALVVGVSIALLYYTKAFMSISTAAAARRRAFCRRLPYAVDLMSLLLDAGANLDEAIRTVGNEEQNNPLGDEFRRVVRQIDFGRTRREALESLRHRMQDPATGELVQAICMGEELGTPMSVILKSQSEHMRMKRTQWGEKAAKEAEVRMVGPNMLIMLACIIVIMGPILLPVLYNVGNPR